MNESWRIKFLKTKKGGEFWKMITGKVNETNREGLRVRFCVVSVEKDKYTAEWVLS